MNDFQFYTKLDQTLLLGLRANTVAGLLAGIRSVPDSSIYFHTHRFLQQHHFLSPEPPNDFAFWVANALGDAALGERLWSIDTIRFNDLTGLRQQLMGILDGQIASRVREIECQGGEEFHFMACRTFVLPTGCVAHDLVEFSRLLAKISINSVYFHMFDAKLRLKSSENDFSSWFRELGMTTLANEIQRLDPYSYTLDGLRQRIVALVRQHDSH